MRRKGVPHDMHKHSSQKNKDCLNKKQETQTLEKVESLQLPSTEEAMLLQDSQLCHPRSPHCWRDRNELNRWDDHLQSTGPDWVFCFWLVPHTFCAPELPAAVRLMASAASLPDPAATVIKQKLRDWDLANVDGVLIIEVMQWKGHTSVSSVDREDEGNWCLDWWPVDFESIYNCLKWFTVLLSGALVVFKNAL